MGRHRQEQVAPRYGRITVLASSLAVVGIAVLGGTGVLPSAADSPDESTSADRAASIRNAAAPSAAPSVTPSAAADPSAPVALDTDEPAASSTAVPPGDDLTSLTPDPALDVALPASSGDGRRIVFSEGRQRVWLVDDTGAVARTYLVSGSLYDNLDPGSYEVYSRSEQAYGIDDSGTMKYFVRFTQGDNAAIGFHDIPIDDGKLVQTKAQLGTPLSHGCIRQKRSDAIALWDFAPLGTSVVVTA